MTVSDLKYIQRILEDKKAAVPIRITRAHAALQLLIEKEVSENG